MFQTHTHSLSVYWCEDEGKEALREDKNELGEGKGALRSVCVFEIIFM